MKHIKLYLTVTLFAVSAIIISGCTDKFEEYNTNPTKLTELDVSGVGNAYAAAQYRGLTNNWQTYQSLFADLYSQYFANIAQGFDSDRNVMVGSWLNGAFNGFYADAMPPLLGVLDNTKPGGKAEHPGIYALANIWKVRMYMPRTDYWGPIPYSQVGNGLKTVEYDSQEFIYKDFLALLKQAVIDLQPYKGQNLLSTNDQIYQGDVNKWILFANTLRLRVAIRISLVEPALAKTEAEAAVAGGTMTDNTHNAFFDVTANSGNPLNEASAWNEFRMSAAMESVLKGYSDPRMPKFFAPVPGTTNTFKGLRNGYSKVDLLSKPENLGTNTSNVADNFLPINEPNQNIGVMMAAEAYFLKAEGVLRGWNMGGTAKAFYEQGIAMSIKQWGVTDDAAITAYVNSTSTPIALADASNSPRMTDISVVWSTDPVKQMEQVITQKWLALYPDGLEAWAEYRRTGYPKLYDRIVSESQVVPKNGVVRRVPFTLGEKQTNATGLATGITKLGGPDNEATRLWWNK